MKTINLNPYLLFDQGLMLSKSIPAIDVIEFINFLKKNYEPVELMRIGENGDGGYLFPNIFKEIKFCFSPGVSTIASFEEQLSNDFDIKSYLADASVNSPPIKNTNFHFTKKFLGARSFNHYITLSDWIKEVGKNNETNLFLQMDIEGSELDVLVKEDMDTLSKFIGMIIEFHSIQKIFEKFTFKMYNAIFSKILEKFCIVHIHPNNCCGLATYENVTIPRVAEFSFLRRDILNNVKRLDKLDLPNKLDFPNLIKNPDISLPDIWWKK